MTIAITPPMKSPALVSVSAAAPLDLNSCRREIERAAAIKLSPNTASLTIRECLLSAGLSPCQASNRTMQARVRREVKHMVSGVARKVSWGEKSRPPCEILIRTAVAVTDAGRCEVDDFDSQVNEIFRNVDEISVLSEPTCFRVHFKQQPFDSAALRVSDPVQHTEAPQHQQPPQVHSDALTNAYLAKPPVLDGTKDGRTHTEERVLDFALEAANKWLEADVTVQ
jgi:hypothetical protein